MKRGTRAAAVVALGVATLAFVRLRGELPVYVRMHRWLRDAGVPDAVRNLDHYVLLVMAAFGGAMLARTANPLRTLGFAGSLRQGLVFGLIAGAPMVVMAAIVHDQVTCSFDVFEGAVLAPFVEETFFRGMLVAAPVACCRAPFWRMALLAGVLFGSAHVSWTRFPDVGAVMTFAVTFAAGVWYAWLMRVYSWSLWPTIALHAVMNAAWLVFSIGGGAVGSGLWPNVGRALTITVGTLLALRHRRRAS